MYTYVIINVMILYDKYIPFLELMNSRCEARPTSFSTDTRVSLPGDKAAGQEDDHTPPSSAVIKNEWKYSSTPHSSYMGAWGSVVVKALRC
jgi:hypothetical protein